MQDHLRVGRRLEDRASLHELVLELAGIDEIAVVPDRDLPVRAIDQNRLRVIDVAVAGRRVAHVTDRDVAGQFFERLFRKRIGHITHRLRDADGAAVRRGDAGAFLAAMLKRIKTQVGQVGSLRVPEDAENAAFFL